MVWAGMVRQARSGMDWRGRLRRGEYMAGKVRKARIGVVWNGMAGMVRYGEYWLCAFRCRMAVKASRDEESLGQAGKFKTEGEEQCSEQISQ